MTNAIDNESRTSFEPSQNLKHDNVRLQIIYLDRDQLEIPKRRLKKYTEEHITGLMASIDAHGPIAPAIVDERNEVIDGEAYVEAMGRLGLRIPVVRIEHLSENSIRLLRLGLKKLPTKSVWDAESLGLEFKELIELDLGPLLETTGFSIPEIEGVISFLDDHLDAEPDSAPEAVQPQAAVSQVGDLWFLGKHRLFNGSSLEKGSFELLMAGELARVVVSDLPYNVKISGHVCGLGKVKHREFLQGAGELSKAEFTDFQQRSISVHSEFCCDGSLQFYFMDWRSGGGMYQAIESAGLSLHNVIVWVKPNGGMGSMYRSRHELVFMAKKGNAPHRNNIQLGKYGRYRTNCWEYSGMNSFGSDRDELLAMHSTVKNLDMICDAIRDASNPGDIVLDGFGGSGTTLIAAEKTGRVCRMIELDPLYVDCIVRRWEKLTGQAARLGASDGPTFGEVAERRNAEEPAQEPALSADQIATPPVIIARARVRRAA